MFVGTNMGTGTRLAARVTMRFSSADRAYQKDLALSASNPDPEPRRGFFLFRTTLSF